MPYGDNQGELLIETSYVQPPMRMDGILRDMQKAGFTPVLAHPERYLYLDMDRYHSLKEAGTLFQRNVGSLEGLYGEAVSVRCEALLDENLFDIIGTDLHSEHYADFFDSFGFKVS